MDYQFRQLSDTAFEMLAEVVPGANKGLIGEALRRQMTDILWDKGLLDVDFDIRFVETITADHRTGKKPLILSAPQRQAAYGA